jgi:hypothetical protein
MAYGFRFGHNGALVLPVVAVLLAACSAAPVNPAGCGDVVLGVLGDPEVSSSTTTLQVVSTLDGREGAKQSKLEPGIFPAEFVIPSANGNYSFALNALTNAASRGGSSTQEVPFGSKLVRVQVACAKEKRLLRIKLDSGCFQTLSVGGTPVPTCTAPLSCIRGVCADSAVSSASLEPYVSNWATGGGSDPCVAPNGEGPELLIGTGQTGYAPLAQDEAIRAQPGPQGGHHLWIALRMKQLKRDGTVITITSQQPGGLAGPTSSFVFSLDQDDGGYCRLYGLRYQIDTQNPMSAFQGKPLEITASAKDASSQTKTTTLRIKVSETLAAP